jgi:hypothetical protein
MKSWSRNLLCAAAGGIALVVATFALTAGPGYREWSYRYFRDDYAKMSWVYDLAIARPLKAENIFMGSSHTYNGVDDSRIAAALGGERAAYNAAIPTEGRDLEFVVLRDILERAKVRRVFIEVRETEERTSHFAFPIVAGVGDILTAPPSPWWPRNLLYSAQSRFEYLVSRIPMLRREGGWEGSAPRFGFVANAHQEARASLEARSDDMKRNKRWHRLPDIFGDAEFSMSITYLRRIAALCREKGIELHFLHLPFLGAPARPAQWDVYAQLGTVHAFPDFLRGDSRYWADVTHLNSEGAKRYTDWLIKNVLTNP